ncbi:AbrB/MazE/SpoVT family DNA-binding domain-containing protein [Varibaculum massiliense]|nr:AbrB/MazE/SpoVT family DNA-binding domain-containing protein [Varibaculum massiliense]
MSTTYAASVGDRGRLVIPSALRRSQKWEQGTQLLMLDTPNGVITMTQK